MKINLIKLEVHHTYRKDEKTTTNFEAVDNEDVKQSLSRRDF